MTQTPSGDKRYKVLGMDYISSLCELKCNQSIVALRKEGEVTDLKKCL